MFHSARPQDDALFIAVALGALIAAGYWIVDASIGTDLAFVKYHLAAAQHLDGVLPPVRRMDFSPLYFEVIALIERWQGDPGLALEPTAWLHRLATAFCGGLLYLVLVRRMPRVWAVAGTLAFAISPHLQTYSRIYEPEILLLLALLGYVVASDRETKGAAFVAGLCAAAATASRPTFLLVFCILGPLGYLLRGLRGQRFAWRCVCFGVPLLACGVGLGLRAHALVGDPFAPVMNPGTVFFEGHHPLSRGTSAAYPISVASLIVLDPNVPDEAHNRYRKVARESLGRNLTTTEVNTFWADRAWNFIADEPGRALANAGDKLWRAMRDVRFHDVGTAERLEARLPIVPGLFGCAVAFAWLGVWFERRAWRVHLALLVFGVAQLGVMTLFYVSARQQMVLLPTLVCFALLGVRGVLASVRQRDPASVAFGAVLLVLLALAFSSDDTIRDHQHRSRGGPIADRLAAELASRTDVASLVELHEEVASVLAHAAWSARENLPGNLDRERRSAFGEAADQLAARGGLDFFDEFDLAVLELEAGRLDVSRQRFERLARTGRRAYRTYQQASDPAFYLGRIAALEGQAAEAESWLLRALEATPGDPYVLAELTALGRGEHDRAQLERYYSRLDADLLIGEALLSHGRGVEAAGVLAEAARSVRRSQRAAVAYAAALGASGEIERGVEIYRRSLEISSTPIVWSDEIVALYRAWVGMHPADVEVNVQAAQVLGFHGRFREASRLLAAFESQDERVGPLLDRLRRTIERSDATFTSN